MDLSWDHFNSSQQAKTHIWSLKQQFGYVGFQEKFNTLQPATPTETNQDWAQFLKAQVTPYKPISHSPLGQEVMSKT